MIFITKIQNYCFFRFQSYNIAWKFLSFYKPGFTGSYIETRGIEYAITGKTLFIFNPAIDIEKVMLEIPSRNKIKHLRFHSFRHREDRCLNLAGISHLIRKYLPKLTRLSFTNVFVASFMLKEIPNLTHIQLSCVMFTDHSWALYLPSLKSLKADTINPDFYRFSISMCNCANLKVFVCNKFISDNSKKQAPISLPNVLRFEFSNSINVSKLHVFIPKAKDKSIDDNRNFDYATFLTINPYILKKKCPKLLKPLPKAQVYVKKTKKNLPKKPQIPKHNFGNSSELFKNLNLIGAGHFITRRKDGFIEGILNQGNCFLTGLQKQFYQLPIRGYTELDWRVWIYKLKIWTLNLQGFQ